MMLLAVIEADHFYVVFCQSDCSKKYIGWGDQSFTSYYYQYEYNFMSSFSFKYWPTWSPEEATYNYSYLNILPYTMAYIWMNFLCTKVTIGIDIS